MKRDMSLIRELLLRLEALPLPPGAVTTLDSSDEELAIEGYASDQVDYHLDQLAQAGFVHGRGSRPMRGISFCGLTWEGHDFLDSVRDPEVWRRTKEGAAKAGGAGIELVWEIAKAYGKQVAKERLGLDL